MCINKVNNWVKCLCYVCACVYICLHMCVHVYVCMCLHVCTCVSESKFTITCIPDCSSLIRSLQRQILIYWVSERRWWVCHRCCLNVLHHRAQCRCSFLETQASTAMAAQAAPANPNCVIIYKIPHLIGSRVVSCRGGAFRHLLLPHLP